MANKIQTLEEDRYLTEGEVAEWTGLSKAWLQRARCYGGGPSFLRISRQIRYKKSVVEAFMDSQPYGNTSQYNDDAKETRSCNSK